MKSRNNIINLLILILLLSINRGFGQSKVKTDSAIVEHFKKNKFLNDEYYVFGFCIPELCKAIETDTTLISKFSTKFARFLKRGKQSKEYYMLQDYAIDDLKKRLNRFTFLKKEYPIGYSSVQKTINSISIHLLSENDYSDLLLQKSDESGWIPFQIDVLLTTKGEEFLKAIKNNEKLDLIYEDWLKDDFKIWCLDGVEPKSLRKRMERNFLDLLKNSKEPLAIKTVRIMKEYGF